MPELNAVGLIPVAAEYVEELRPVVATLAEATLEEEEGCLSYVAYESQSTPGTFVTVERWRSQDDLDAHMNTPHVATAFAALEGKAGGEVTVHPLAPVS